jgi:hypothetical protein
MDNDEVEEQDVMKQLVWCIPEGHEAPFSEFWQESGGGDILYYVCGDCRMNGVSDFGLIWTQ